jgi:hypothetical protein
MFSNQHNLKTRIIDHRGEIFVKIDSRNLTVSTCNEYGSNNSISLDFKYPLALDSSYYFWYIIFLDYFPNFLCIHVIKIFLNLYPQFFSIIWIACLVNVTMIQIFESCYTSLHVYQYWNSRSNSRNSLKYMTTINAIILST